MFPPAIAPSPLRLELTGELHSAAHAGAIVRIAKRHWLALFFEGESHEVDYRDEELGDAFACHLVDCPRSAGIHQHPDCEHRRHTRGIGNRDGRAVTDGTLTIRRRFRSVAGRGGPKANLVPRMTQAIDDVVAACRRSGTARVRLAKVSAC
ncbi:MAG TPA: hypothetical protein DDZ51_28305 [Planctomycetaceae bacterium]|nr:hypothetical protein [Planctomycetaceae bacterium]